MKIAIFGATSEIAKDLILSFASNDSNDLTLFARRPDIVEQWLGFVGLEERFRTLDFDAFDSSMKFDAILNFVGVGDLAKAQEMGAAIVEVTERYDNLALNYLTLHPECKYIFMSSGAAYGTNFSEPATEDTQALIPINHIKADNFYAIAKILAELRHRSLFGLNIVDVRIFNYIGRTQNLNSGYLIADVINAIKNKALLLTSSENIVRDYLSPADFHQIIQKTLLAPSINTAIDCYSKSPISKFQMLSVLQDRFDLRYELSPVNVGINATGAKFNYYSLNHLAEQFGYIPSLDSITSILMAAEIACRD